MKRLLFAIALSLSPSALPAVGSPLDDRIDAYKDAANSPTEAQVIAVLKLGLDEHRSSEAIAAVQPWLNRNTLSDEAGLLFAGQAAERSGQWLVAVGYYQRLLQAPKLNPKLAGPAVDAVYRLLLNALGDEQSAYLYMRNDGNRLRAFGNAKRYDRWFLKKAMSQRDMIAVAQRLEALMADKSIKPEDYASELEWFCTELEHFRKEDTAVYEAAAALAKQGRTPKVAQARLNWASTVIPYNLKLDELRQANAPADPKLTDAPLAVAAELLKHEPDHGAIVVAKGWGTEYDGHHGTCALRFQVEGDRKLTQLLDVVPKMSPGKRDDLLAYPIARGRIKFDPLELRQLILKHPESFNRMDVARVPYFDKATLTVEEAKKLAPHLARNPHPEAAMVRSIAASGSLEASKIAEAMIKSEAWRFKELKDAVNTAWQASTVQDLSNKDFQKQFGKNDSRFDELLKQIGKKAASTQRIAAFNTLYKDLASPAPTLPAAIVLWEELFKNAPDADLVQMIKVMVQNTDGERGMLLKRAMPHFGFGKRNSGKMFWQADVYENQFRHHRKPVQDAVPELIAHLQSIVAKQGKAGKIDPVIFGMWLHVVDPKNEDAKELVAQLVTTKAYLALDPAYHAAVADNNHFGMAMATPAIKQSQPWYASRELLSLSKEANAKQVEAAFNTVMKRVAGLYEPTTVVGLEPVAALSTWSEQTQQQVLSLFRENAPIGAYPNKQGYEPLVEKLADMSREQKRWGDLEPYLAGIWLAAHAKDHHTFEGVPRLVQFAESALEADQMSVAISMARSGLTSRAGQTLVTSNDDRYKQLAGRLSQVQGKASIAIGIIDIPVDERDPAYPIYKSQAEFAIGNTESAWELYEKHNDQLLPVVRQLTVPYCLWVLEREIAALQGERAEGLIRELTVWSREAAGTFTPEQDAELKIAYADAAFQSGKLQTAKAWYRRVADAEAYRGTPLEYKAVLRSVDVDRASKDFDSAMNELDKLMVVRDDELRKRVHYARAEVLFDQENYAEAFSEVSTVLKRDPNHADALILLGKAQLEMRKLVDASEIELGVSRDQKLIVPGEVIKINLSDPALNISGVGADIEVEIWTKSGDRERVMLHQLGDDKTKFRAEVQTALAPRTPGDKVLQVLGRDEIQYGYSKRFRAKMTDLPPDPEIVITVASDANLAATAGAFPPRAGERRLDLEELGVSTAQQKLGTRRVRPGNPVYIRVTDPDQSKTDKVDEIAVSIQTSNGDLIPRLIMKETGPHTGQFEAAVPTGRAQALAYASESAPGRDPNMVISATDYPGWSGEVGSKAEFQSFTIDLNDNAEPRDMTIVCDDPTQRLTHFVLQTSMDGSTWHTRARFPSVSAAWDGRPHITAFPTYNRNSLPISEAEDRTVPEDWLEKMEIASAAGDIKYGAFTVPTLQLDGLELPSGGHPGYPVLIRYRAYFYQEAAAVRTFQLAGLPNGDKVQTLFLIDGKPAAADQDDALTITRELSPGLHTIEFWRHESRGELQKRKPRLLQNVAGKEALSPCPDTMFDPANFPQGVRESISQPATITTSGEKPNQFDVSFGKATRTRLVRLAIVGHEGAAPAINRIELTDRTGVKRLPVKTDYQSLRQNEQLEVVPGDSITVRYEDDRVVTPNRASRQTGLSVAYDTAQISASFLTYEVNKEGERELVLEPIRRFKMDDAVGIVIEDADLDQTPNPDQVTLTVTSSAGTESKVVALETGEHTGVFLGRVFPIEGKPTRDAEIQVPEGGTITAVYRDEENLDPGIPTDRVVTIEHARFTKPSLALYDVDSKALPMSEPQADEEVDERGPEIILPRRTLMFSYVDPSAGKPSKKPSAVIGSSLRFDVMASHLAFAPSSEIVAYVQTSSGRAAYKQEAGGQAFDIRVPGTLKLTAKPSRSAATLMPPGYTISKNAVAPSLRPAIDEGRFAFSVPVMLGDTPTRSFATKAAESLPSSMVPDALAIRPGDTVYVGFAYLDDQGDAQWITGSAELESHALLDVMNSRYRKGIADAFVGEKLYVRLIAPHLDTGPDRDSTSVRLKAESGASVAYELRESEAHSGVFKGSFTLSYASQPTPEKLPSVVLHGLPVKYGDTVSVAYGGSGDDLPPTIEVSINKGADGLIEPFTKRYGEDAVAIQTTFTLAECFFELAKHHRKMEQESLARREMAHAQKLLAEAIETHRDDEMQAHAEYLLGNLAQEYADLSKNEVSKRQMYQDALARFAKIPLDYPDTEFAPKAQFKKALVYEKLGEVDIAVEEYVKLAYKYPEHELIPSVMSRLGSYFQSQGKAFKDQAEFMEKQEDRSAETEGEIINLREKMTREYINAAQVFKKLNERFPTDPLAGLAGLRSAQNYMRAGDFAAAIEGFQKVVDTETYDGKNIRSQALFWMGISQERLNDHREAYEIYRRVTFDFPDSVWAKQARGRLADPAFAEIIRQEELIRERMLEALKEEAKKRR